MNISELRKKHHKERSLFTAMYLSGVCRPDHLLAVSHARCASRDFVSFHRFQQLRKLGDNCFAHYRYVQRSRLISSDGGPTIDGGVAPVRHKTSAVFSHRIFAFSFEDAMTRFRQIAQATMVPCGQPSTARLSAPCRAPHFRFAHSEAFAQCNVLATTARLTLRC